MKTVRAIALPYTTTHTSIHQTTHGQSRHCPLTKALSCVPYPYGEWEDLGGHDEGDGPHAQGEEAHEHTQQHHQAPRRPATREAHPRQQQAHPTAHRAVGLEGTQHKEGLGEGRAFTHGKAGVSTPPQKPSRCRMDV